MFKHTVKYTDFDGNPQVEDLYFNLSKAEFLRWEMEESTLLGDLAEGQVEGVQGGLSKRLETLMKSGKGREIINAFDEIIKRAYGKRSEDGRRFIKSEQLSEEFLQTEAYQEFFMWILEGNNSVTFINSVIPSDLDRDKPTGPTTVQLPQHMQPRTDAPPTVHRNQFEQAQPLPQRVPGESIVQATEDSIEVSSPAPGVVEQKSVSQMTDEELQEYMRSRNIQQ